MESSKHGHFDETVSYGSAGLLHDPV